MIIAYCYKFSHGISAKKISSWVFSPLCGTPFIRRKKNVEQPNRVHTFELWSVSDNLS